jgi:nicotinate-nucleotide adenylyltransferase
MRIGLYGGSFDPVHCGHLLVAHAALEELSLDRLIFLPASQSPFKPGSIPAAGSIRSRMLRVATAGGSRFTVSEMELQRGGVSYTVDTVAALAADYPAAELFWLIGADHVPTLPKWRESDRLASMVTFVVIPRPGQADATLPPPWRLVHLAGWPVKISSSELRQRVGEGKPIAHLVPAGVAEVIEKEGCYRPTSSA